MTEQGKHTPLPWKSVRRDYSLDKSAEWGSLPPRLCWSWRRWCVTVCIAVIADHGKQIVLASDSKVAFGDFSADRAVVKNVPLIGEYTVLFAGNDVDHFGPVINRARSSLQKGAVNDPDKIAEVIFEELQRQRDRIAEAKILRKHLFDLPTFRNQGPSLCTDSVFYDIHSQLEQVKLSLDVLIAGFDEKGDAHLRFTNSTTPPTDYDVIGFYAVGTGANTALGSLSHAVEYLDLSKYADLEEAIYHALAAKYLAESASDVGRDTFLVTIKAKEKSRFLNVLCGDAYIRSQWKQRGAPRIPQGITEAISDLLCSVEEGRTIERLERCKKYLSKDGRKFVRSLGRVKQSGAQKSKPEQ